MDIKTALQHLENGKKIRVTNWASHWFLDLAKDGTIIMHDGAHLNHLTRREIQGVWEVFKDGTKVSSKKV
jgi:hypothetical protein